ncbi:MAG: hypothetical protein KAX30_04430 [Candidatus Atribacteria bacterium]|nr:hypothetical protein [Candidatus Atribacteria bacterium]
MENKNVVGMDVVVYSRYLFAVPVRGYITAISAKDGAYQVSFYTDNPGSPNVIKHDGKYFLKEQCRVYPPKKGQPMLGLATTEELLKEISARIEVAGLLHYKTVK